MMAHDNYDLVVIGGGVIGVSSAFQAARRGARVAVLERGAQVASGSTGQSAAVVRQRYANIELVSLSYHSLCMFENWCERLEIRENRCGFTSCGVVWIAEDDADAMAVSERQFKQVGAVGGAAPASEVRDRYPSLNLCARTLDMTGRTHPCAEPSALFWEPRAGFADPQGTTEDLAAAGISKGVKLFLKHEVVGIDTVGGRVCAVRCGNGVTFGCDKVLNAAGPWCGRINDMLGVTLPMELRPTRVEIALRDRPAEVVGEIPVFISTADQLYGRPETRGGQLLAGSTDPADECDHLDDPDALDPAGTPAFRDRMMHKLHHRFAMKSKGAVRGYAAMYTVNTTDWHPIIDAVGPDGFYVANGFSGHGFKLGPSVGAMIGRLITQVALPDDPTVGAAYFAAGRKPITASGGVLA
jgi:glycine/D-amino acid oxidase-like deaminating enzyme